MKIAIVYASKSGFTKHYAEWLAKDLSVPLFELKKTAPEQLQMYDLIIYGGGLYAAGINGLKRFKKWLPELKHPQLVVFATGATPDREDVVPLLLRHNFTQEEQPHVKIFYLRGGFNYEKLTPVDKFLMTAMKWKIKIKRPDQRSLDEKGMLASYTHPADFTKRTAIDPLLAYIKSMSDM